VVEELLREADAAYRIRDHFLAHGGTFWASSTHGSSTRSVWRSCV
jgi:hypothetical protein